MDNTYIYYQKYLKYKLKYLHLKGGKPKQYNIINFNDTSITIDTQQLYTYVNNIHSEIKNICLDMNDYSNIDQSLTNYLDNLHDTITTKYNIKVIINYNDINSNIMQYINQQLNLYNMINIDKNINNNLELVSKKFNDIIKSIEDNIKIYLPFVYINIIPILQYYYSISYIIDNIYNQQINKTIYENITNIKESILLNLFEREHSNSNIALLSMLKESILSIVINNTLDKLNQIYSHMYCPIKINECITLEYSQSINYKHVSSSIDKAKIINNYIFSQIIIDVSYIKEIIKKIQSNINDFDNIYNECIRMNNIYLSRDIITTDNYTILDNIQISKDKLINNIIASIKITDIKYIHTYIQLYMIRVYIELRPILRYYFSVNNKYNKANSIKKYTRQISDLLYLETKNKITDNIKEYIFSDIMKN